MYKYLYYRPGEYSFASAFPSLEYPGMVKVLLSLAELSCSCIFVEFIFIGINVVCVAQVHEFYINE